MVFFLYKQKRQKIALYMMISIWLCSLSEISGISFPCVVIWVSSGGLIMQKYITLEKARDIIYSNDIDWSIERIHYSGGIIGVIIRIHKNYYEFYYSKGITTNDDTINTKEKRDVNLYSPSSKQREYHVKLISVKKVIIKKSEWKKI